MYVKVLLSQPWGMPSDVSVLRVRRLTSVSNLRSAVVA